MVYSSCFILFSYLFLSSAPKDDPLGQSDKIARRFASEIQYIGNISQPFHRLSDDLPFYKATVSQFGVSHVQSKSYGVGAKVVRFTSERINGIDIIVSETGDQILGYLNRNATTGNSNVYGTNSEPISKLEAIHTGKRTIELAGNGKDFRYFSATYSSVSSGRNISNQIWTVSFQRFYKGIPYYRESANVIINASSGCVIAMGVVSLLRQPTLIIDNINQTRATEICNAERSRLKLLDYNLIKMERNIVPLRLLSEPNNSPSISNDETRLAWIGLLQYHNIQREIWVDAATGDIIAGSAGQ